MRERNTDRLAVGSTPLTTRYATAIPISQRDTLGRMYPGPLASNSCLHPLANDGGGALHKSRIAEIRTIDTARMKGP